MTDVLRLEYINSLPQPLFVKLGGAKVFWPVDVIDVETGLMRIDVCGKFQNTHIGEATEFVDSDMASHDPETFYSDYING